MVAEEVYQEILEFLKKRGPLNTFRLATDLNVDRYKLLNIIERLETAGAVEVRHGLVKFLKFAVKKRRQKNRLKSKKQFSSQRRRLSRKEKNLRKNQSRRKFRQKTKN